MRESTVEQKLRTTLEALGFKVLKLRTPGNSGVMDRMILRPVWSPGPPSFVELKAPGKFERALQAEVSRNWYARGLEIHSMCDTIERVMVLCWNLIIRAVVESTTPYAELPDHIKTAYAKAHSEVD